MLRDAILDLLFTLLLGIVIHSSQDNCISTSEVKEYVSIMSVRLDASCNYFSFWVYEEILLILSLNWILFINVQKKTLKYIFNLKLSTTNVHNDRLITTPLF